jgi:hypothetical protein
MFMSLENVEVSFGAAGWTVVCSCSMVPPCGRMVVKSGCANLQKINVSVNEKYVSTRLIAIQVKKP